MLASWDGWDVVARISWLFRGEGGDEVSDGQCLRSMHCYIYPSDTLATGI